MRIYATYNIKGGVGKTTTAVNLAYLAAESGLRTVLWDLDPQGAASFMFRVKPKVKGGGRALISGKRPLDDAIKGTDFDNLDLIPADFTYRNMDLLLDPGDATELDSLTEVAKRAGVAKSTLSQLESGTGNPSVETLWALAVALDTPFAALLDPPRPKVQIIRAGEGPVIYSDHAEYSATLVASIFQPLN